MKLIDRDKLKETMIHYGFHSPDMTVTEFVEDILTTIEVEPGSKEDNKMTNKEIIDYAKDVPFCCGCDKPQWSYNDEVCTMCNHRQFFTRVIEVFETLDKVKEIINDK